MSLQATTWQTIGPFFQIGFAWLYRGNLAGPEVSGERVEISGRILDGDGQPVPDGIIETWQANSLGKYAHPDDPLQKEVEAGFTGFGRIATDEEGRFRFATIKPGRVPGPHGSLQAPHITVSVFTRGLMRRLTTRIYFPDDASNDEDFALGLVEVGRRRTLIARKIDERPGTLEWNVVLQGDGETVFFDA
jgi:protocatechuate 3,4-dioxygenase, alpha subunit